MRANARYSISILTIAALAVVAAGCSGGSSGGGGAPFVPTQGSGNATAPATSTSTAPASTVTTIQPAPLPGPNETPPNLKVAFVGDQGLGADARAVLQLIKNEGAELVLHQGDFDYSSDPQAWDDQIDSILGANFAYLASPGNHDLGEWRGAAGYQKKLEARANRLNITWQGSLGEESTLTYKGLFIVLVGPDVTGPGDGNYDVFIKNALANDNAIWSIASWHKNMNAYQCGGKGDDTGWGVYEESRRGGAIIATGHEHSYSRTLEMSHMENTTVSSTNPALIDLFKDDPATAAVDEGRSFVFVSGLTGRGVRNQDRGGAWWASIYTSDQNATYGVLFGEFHVNGDPRMARFYFKNINGTIIDEFFVKSNL